MSVDAFIKMSCLEAYLTVNSFDIVCLSETFLDSSVSKEDNIIKLQGYNFIRIDHPSNTKKGGVCLYYKEHLPLISQPDLTRQQECIICELKVGNKKCFISLLYRSPSPTNEEFNDFKLKWEETIKNMNNFTPYISVFIGDFNARNTK